MVLELHIWGPAFSLPSIDPQCLATIAYLVQAVPEDAWVLVASSDPSVSPTSTSELIPWSTIPTNEIYDRTDSFPWCPDELPALKDGATWVSKFRNIVDYLRQYSNGEWDLDSRLEGLERADSIAYVMSRKNETRQC
jgi:sorting and assembly machinery component 37